MNSLKKKLSVLLALAVCLTSFAVAPFAFGDDLVDLNDPANFPDKTFRDVIAKRYDADRNGFLSAEERSTTEMFLSEAIDPDKQSIKSLQGIEFFPNLVTLRCGGINLESLDTSKLYNLVDLSCQGNYLTTLDVSRNYELEKLDCSDNNLISIKLPNDNKLKSFYCSANMLESIDISRHTNIVAFRCDQNQITSLNLEKSTKLALFNCSENHLSTLDLSKTALTDITDYEIGRQSITLKAEIEFDQIIIPIEADGLSFINYRGCTLDLIGDGSRFEGNRFVTYDVDNFKDGITYEVYPMLDNAENMTVTVTVLRDFSQVGFYTDDSLSERIGIAFTDKNGAVTAPSAPQAPQCKVFDGWSEELTDITEDKAVYAVWNDDHTYAPVSMAADKDTVTVKCQNCDSSYDVSFISIVNSKTGDNIFDKNIDVVSDGYINAKDYDKLLKMFK